MPAEVDEASLRRRQCDHCGIEAEIPAILAALERAERVEKVLAELVKRASDPDIRSTSFGAWHMLYTAAENGLRVLEGRDG